MSFYGFGFRETLDLPIAAFLLFSRNIDRHMAEHDTRQVTIATHITTSEGVEKLGESLGSQIGKTFEYEVEPQPALKVDPYDREGLLALKNLGKFV
jgi:hypothetical protein